MKITIEDVQEFISKMQPETKTDENGKKQIGDRRPYYNMALILICGIGALPESLLLGNSGSMTILFSDYPHEIDTLEEKYKGVEQIARLESLFIDMHRIAFLNYNKLINEKHIPTAEEKQKWMEELKIRINPLLAVMKSKSFTRYTKNMFGAQDEAKKEQIIRGSIVDIHKFIVKNSTLKSAEKSGPSKSSEVPTRKLPPEGRERAVEKKGEKTEEKGPNAEAISEITKRNMERPMRKTRIGIPYGPMPAIKVMKTFFDQQSDKVKLAKALEGKHLTEEKEKTLTSIKKKIGTEFNIEFEIAKRFLNPRHKSFYMKLRKKLSVDLKAKEKGVVIDFMQRRANSLPFLKTYIAETEGFDEPKDWQRVLAAITILFDKAKSDITIKENVLMDINKAYKLLPEGKLTDTKELLAKLEEKISSFNESKREIKRLKAAKDAALESASGPAEKKEGKLTEAIGTYNSAIETYNSDVAEFIGSDDYTTFGVIRENLKLCQTSTKNLDEKLKFKIFDALLDETILLTKMQTHHNLDLKIKTPELKQIYENLVFLKKNVKRDNRKLNSLLKHHRAKDNQLSDVVPFPNELLEDHIYFDLLLTPVTEAMAKITKKIVAANENYSKSIHEVISSVKTPAAEKDKMYKDLDINRGLNAYYESLSKDEDLIKDFTIMVGPNMQEIVLLLKANEKNSKKEWGSEEEPKNWNKSSQQISIICAQFCLSPVVTVRRMMEEDGKMEVRIQDNSPLHKYLCAVGNPSKGKFLFMPLRREKGKFGSDAPLALEILKQHDLKEHMFLSIEVLAIKYQRMLAFVNKMNKSVDLTVAGKKTFVRNLGILTEAIQNMEALKYGIPVELAEQFSLAEGIIQDRELILKVTNEIDELFSHQNEWSNKDKYTKKPDDLNQWIDRVTESIKKLKKALSRVEIATGNQYKNKTELLANAHLLLEEKLPEAYQRALVKEKALQAGKNEEVISTLERITEEFASGDDTTERAKKALDSIRAEMPKYVTGINSDMSDIIATIKEIEEKLINGLQKLIENFDIKGKKYVKVFIHVEKLKSLTMPKDDEANKAFDELNAKIESLEKLLPSIKEKEDKVLLNALETIETQLQEFDKIKDEDTSSLEKVADLIRKVEPIQQKITESKTVYDKFGGKGIEKGMLGKITAVEELLEALNGKHESMEAAIQKEEQETAREAADAEKQVEKESDIEAITKELQKFKQLLKLVSGGDKGTMEDSLKCSGKALENLEKTLEGITGIQQCIAKITARYKDSKMDNEELDKAITEVTTVKTTLSDVITAEKRKIAQNQVIIKDLEGLYVKASQEDEKDPAKYIRSAFLKLNDLKDKLSKDKLSITVKPIYEKQVQAFKNLIFKTLDTCLQMTEDKDLDLNAKQITNISEAMDNLITILMEVHNKELLNLSADEEVLLKNIEESAEKIKSEQLPALRKQETEEETKGEEEGEDEGYISAESLNTDDDMDEDDESEKRPVKDDVSALLLTSMIFNKKSKEKPEDDSAKTATNEGDGKSKSF